MEDVLAAECARSNCGLWKRGEKTIHQALLVSALPRSSDRCGIYVVLLLPVYHDMANAVTLLDFLYDSVKISRSFGLE